MHFFEPRVRYCPLEMNPILKAILEHNELRRFRDVVKYEMLIAVLHEVDSKYYFENTILAIVRMECEKILNIERLTRSSYNLVKRISNRVIVLRRQRIEEEKYRRDNFINDVRRSLCALNYVVSNTLNHH